VYTAFLLLVLVGMVSMAAFELYHIGPTPSRAAAYYRGGERGGEMAFAKTFRELVEITHFLFLHHGRGLSGAGPSVHPLPLSVRRSNAR